MKKDQKKTQARGVGAPPKKEGEKLTASSYPVHMQPEDFERYGQYCLEQGIKPSEFFRNAAKKYMAKAPRSKIVPYDKKASGKTYIVRMTTEDMEACKAFAKEHDISLADFFRSAADWRVGKKFKPPAESPLDKSAAVKATRMLCQNIKNGTPLNTLANAQLLREQVRLAVGSDTKIAAEFAAAIQKRITAGDSVALIAGHDKTWKSFILRLVPSENRKQWSPRTEYRRITDEDIQDAIQVLKQDGLLKAFAEQRDINHALLSIAIKAKTGQTPREIKEEARQERHNLLSTAVARVVQGEKVAKVAQEIGLSAQALAEEVVARTGVKPDRIRTN